MENDRAEITRPVWGWSALGVLLMWLAQPPLCIWPVGWIALFPWGMLVLNQHPLRRRGWLALWFSGAALWMLTMQGVRLAHPALYPGWVALGLYLGAFPPLFVALARHMHHRWYVPIWLVIPVVWTGLEWIRSNAFTGISAVLLGHSQADVPILIQIADLSGTYAVSFVLACVSGGVVTAIQFCSSARRFRSVELSSQIPESAIATQSATSGRSLFIGITLTSFLILGTVVYGAWRLQQANELAKQSPLLRALLIQRNEPLVFNLDQGRELEIFDHYFQTSVEGMTKHPQADLIVWPESMFSGGIPWRILGDNWQVPAGMEMREDEFQQAIQTQQQYFRSRVSELGQIFKSAANRTHPPEMLVGCAVYRYGATPQALGGAVHINRDSQVADWYGKMHLVMFGEYIPFGNQFPWLYSVTPLAQGVTPGDSPVSLNVANVKITPSICFETMVEHVTGRGLRYLQRAGRGADVIVNLTNDAWFHGSSILNHHCRCSQFVAVANRRPLLMAANQGPTVAIDGSGRIISALPFQTNGFLLAEPTQDSRWSLYQSWGDALVWPLVFVCLAIVLHACVLRLGVRIKTGRRIAT